MLGRWKPPYKTGYELGFKGTTEEIGNHIEEAYQASGWAYSFASKSQKWHCDNKQEVLRGVLDAVKAGRLQVLADYVRTSQNLDYESRFKDTLQDMTVEQIKSMNLDQYNFSRLLEECLRGDTNLPFMKKLVEAGADVHYGDEQILRKAAHSSKDEIVDYLCREAGANFKDAYHGVALRENGEQAQTTKTRLYAYELKLTGKTSLVDSDLTIMQLRDDIKTITEQNQELQKQLAAAAAQGYTPPSPSGGSFLDLK